MTIVLEPGPEPWPPPRSYRSTDTFAFRAQRPLIRWMRDQASIEGITPSQWLNRLVRRERDYPALPGDCREWLTIQAATAGYPHDPDRALVDVLRRLMDAYPHGTRPGGAGGEP